MYEYSKPAAIVYHQPETGIDCPDGIAAAWVAYQWLREIYPSNNISVVGDVYLNANDYGEGYRHFAFDRSDLHLVVVDFSYPQHVLERLANDVRELTVIDHHKTRAEDLSQAAVMGRGEFIYSPEECGATAAWNYFFPSVPRPWFLTHVRNRDIGANGYYRGEIPDSEAFNEALSYQRKGLVGKDAFVVFDRLYRHETDPIEMLRLGERLLQKSAQIVDRVVTQWENQSIKDFLEVGEYRVPYLHIIEAEAYRLCSKIGNELARRNPDAPFVAFRVGDSAAIGLRSTSNSTVDCGAVAKSLGGGGHKNAAGYTPVWEVRS